MMDVEYLVSVGIRTGPINTLKLSAKESSDFFENHNTYSDYVPALKALTESKDFCLLNSFGPMDCRETLMTAFQNVNHFINTALLGGFYCLVKIDCSGELDNEFGEYFRSLSPEDQKELVSVLKVFIGEITSPLVIDVQTDNSLSISFYANTLTSWMKVSSLLLALRIIKSSTWKGTPSYKQLAYLSILEYADKMEEVDPGYSDDDEYYDSSLHDLGMDRISIIALATSVFVHCGLVGLMWDGQSNGPATFISNDFISFGDWKKIIKSTPEKYLYLLKELSTSYDITLTHVLKEGE